jgi:hypothetical protein
MRSPANRGRRSRFGFPCRRPKNKGGRHPRRGWRRLSDEPLGVPAPNECCWNVLPRAYGVNLCAARSSRFCARHAQRRTGKRFVHHERYGDRYRVAAGDRRTTGDCRDFNGSLLASSARIFLVSPGSIKTAEGHHDMGLRIPAVAVPVDGMNGEFDRAVVACDKIYTLLSRDRNTRAASHRNARRKSRATKVCAKIGNLLDTEPVRRGREKARGRTALGRGGWFA